MSKHSMMEQLKAQLMHERAIAEDETINVMPDSGNVDAFAKPLVSAAEPTNLSLKARNRFGGEADGVVSVLSEDADEFGGNENNRRVFERIQREKAESEGRTVATRQRQRQAQSDASDASVVGDTVNPAAAAPAEGQEAPKPAGKGKAAAGAWKPQA